MMVAGIYLATAVVTAAVAKQGGQRGVLRRLYKHFAITLRGSSF